MADRLHDLELFQGIDPAKLAKVTPEAIQFYSPGTELLTQGSRRRSMFVILAGSVEIRRWATDERDTRAIRIGTRGVGTIVGEQSFLDGLPHSADVVTYDDVEALRLEPELADELIADPAFARNLANILSGKLREASEQRYQIRARSELLFATLESTTSPQIASMIVRTGNSNVEPRRADVAVLMCDIRGFTSTSAKMDPLELASELGGYFGAMHGIITEAEGMVDKYIGDAVMAIWGYTPLLSTSCDRIFAVAQEMVARAGALRIDGNPIKIGVGINVGDVFLGNVGPESKRQFTVLGDVVNRAARYESETKHRGVDIFVGEAFYERLSDSARKALKPFPGISLHNLPAPETLYGMSARHKEN